MLGLIDDIDNMMLNKSFITSKLVLLVLLKSIN